MDSRIDANVQPPHRQVFRHRCRARFPLDFTPRRPNLPIPGRVCDASPPPSLPTNQSLTTVDLQEIRKIVELMNEHGLTHFDLTKKDFHLKLKKGADLEDLRGLLASLPAAVAAPVAAAIPAAAPAAVPAAAPVSQDAEITSPMVGTFYLKSSPEAPALVNVGDAIAIGQTLCIIEAMKVMNEIKAERAGTLSAIVAEDGSPVQYGDVLFRIK